MDGPLLVERPRSGVVLVTLALSERRNAMTPELTAAWAQVMDSLDRDETARAVVVTGAGTAFCAGGDLSWLGHADTDDGAEATPAQLRARMYGFYRTWLRVRDLEVPVLAAVNGPAIGAGLCLALACDLRYAAPTARLSMPFVALGLHPGMAATYLLPEAVGVARAREILYTGRVVGASEAVELGLVNQVFPADRLIEEALDVAATVAAAAPIAVRLTKAALRHGPRSYAEALKWEALAQPVTMATQDLQEGLRAAGEKRSPRFQGR
ncbi:MAG: enoyl-CoA hydratase/isomerase family protein [Frankiaceae bacterium]